MKTKDLIMYLGIFLLLDGILSIIFGHQCLNSCFNNNIFGDFIRIVRAGIGGYLIYYAKR